MCTKYSEFSIKQTIENDMLLKAKATKKFKTVPTTQRVPKSEKDEKTLEKTTNNSIQQEPTWRLMLHLMF